LTLLKVIINRGAKIRFIIDIKKENFGYCKEIINLVDEYRHLDGIKDGIALSENELYLQHK
jgi:hypothetical protein